MKKLTVLVLIVFLCLCNLAIGGLNSSLFVPVTLEATDISQLQALDIASSLCKQLGVEFEIAPEVNLCVWTIRDQRVWVIEWGKEGRVILDATTGNPISLANYRRIRDIQKALDDNVPLEVSETEAVSIAKKLCSTLALCQEYIVQNPILKNGTWIVKFIRTHQGYECRDNWILWHISAFDGGLVGFGANLRGETCPVDRKVTEQEAIEVARLVASQYLLGIDQVIACQLKIVQPNYLWTPAFNPNNLVSRLAWLVTFGGRGLRGGWIEIWIDAVSKEFLGGDFTKGLIPFQVRVSRRSKKFALAMFRKARRVQIKDRLDPQAKPFVVKPGRKDYTDLLKGIEEADTTPELCRGTGKGKGIGFLSPRYEIILYLSDNVKQRALYFEHGDYVYLEKGKEYPKDGDVYFWPAEPFKKVVLKAKTKREAQLAQQRREKTNKVEAQKILSFFRRAEKIEGVTRIGLYPHPKEVAIKLDCRKDRAKFNRILKAIENSSIKYQEKVKMLETNKRLALPSYFLKLQLADGTILNGFYSEGDARLSLEITAKKPPFHCYPTPDFLQVLKELEVQKLKSETKRGTFRCCSVGLTLL